MNLTNNVTSTTVDIITGAVLLLGLFIGAKRGFIKSVGNLLVTIVSVVGAKLVSSVIAGPVTDFIYPRVEEKLISQIRIGALDPSGVTIVDRAVESFEGSAADLMKTTAQAFVSSIVKAVCFLVCFVVLLIVLKLLVSLLDKVFDLPLLNSVNTILGGALGLIETVLIVFLVTYLSRAVGISFFDNLAEGTHILNFFVHGSPYDLISLIA